MSRDVLPEQRANLTPSALPARTTEPQSVRRLPLPDLGEPGNHRLSGSIRRYQPTTQGPMRVVVHDLRTHKPKPRNGGRPPQRTVPAPNTQAPKQSRSAAKHQRHRAHRLTLIGFGMLLMALLYFLSIGIGAWLQSKNDDWTYGNPRTYHTDHRVGHGDSLIPSHFIAMNLSRQVRIIEFPGNDASKAKIYVGPVLQGKDQEYAPVTLAFRDVNQDRKPDMLILVRPVVVGLFLNDVINEVPQFRPVQPEEQISLEKGL